MLDNPNPVVLQTVHEYKRPTGALNAEEIFDLIRCIKDPEHPYTLEQLSVVSEDLIAFSEDYRRLSIQFTPTVPHCSLSTMIGLSIRVKLQQYLPKITKVEIKVVKGSHQQEEEVNKQLNDKERVSAALENPYLMEVIESNIREPDF